MTEQVDTIRLPEGYKDYDLVEASGGWNPLSKAVDSQVLLGSLRKAISDNRKNSPQGIKIVVDLGGFEKISLKGGRYLNLARDMVMAIGGNLVLGGVSEKMQKSLTGLGFGETFTTIKLLPSEFGSMAKEK